MSKARENRTHFLSITLSSDEQKRVEAAAESEHRYKSDWARSVILKELDRLKIK